jgi:NlpC/P60 family putative phage cell wall peptidase
MTPERVIAEARNWLGTPYRHQGRQRTVAVDCIGLVFGVMHAVGLGSSEFWIAFNRKHRSYKRVPDGHSLHDIFSLYTPEYPKTQAKPGDVLLICMAGMPRHTAILSERGSIIHAHSEAHGCIEQPWTDTWYRDTASAFRICATEFLDGWPVERRRA